MNCTTIEGVCKSRSLLCMAKEASGTNLIKLRSHVDIHYGWHPAFYSLDTVDPADRTARLSVRVAYGYRRCIDRLDQRVHLAGVDACHRAFAPLET